MIGHVTTGPELVRLVRPGASAHAAVTDPGRVVPTAGARPPDDDGAVVGSRREPAPPRDVPDEAD